jgi:hypothetical protein
LLYIIYCRRTPKPPNNVGNSKDDACHLPRLILTALTLSMMVTLSMMLTLTLAPKLSLTSLGDLTRKHAL